MLIKIHYIAIAEWSYSYIHLFIYHKITYHAQYRSNATVTYFILHCTLPILLFIFIFSLFVFLGPHSWLYGGSQARGESELQPSAYPTAQQHKIRAASATYTTAHCNTVSLTHWSRLGIEPTSSWILVRFVITEPQLELLKSSKINHLWCAARTQSHWFSCNDSTTT